MVEGRRAPGDALAWAAERIAALVRGRALDVGCGEGRFLPRDGVGLDLDPARLRVAAARSPHLVQADAHALPFPSETFDTVLANRMLNEAGRIDDVLAEIRRVLRPEGQLLVLTLATRSPSTLRRLHDEARSALGFRRGPRGEDRLDDENGASRLERHFAGVRAERFRVTHRFADPAAALDHYARRYLFSRDRDAAQTAALFEHVRGALLRTEGEIVDEDAACLFVATISA